MHVASMTSANLIGMRFQKIEQMFDEPAANYVHTACCADRRINKWSRASSARSTGMTPATEAAYSHGDDPFGTGASRREAAGQNIVNCSLSENLKLHDFITFLVCLK